MKMPKEVGKLTTEELTELALDIGIDIWTNRAAGLTDKRDCPLCDLLDLLLFDNCGRCPIYECYGSPFGAWTHWRTPKEDEPFYADEMVNYLVAVKNGWESQYYYRLLYTKYLGIW